MATDPETLAQGAENEPQEPETEVQQPEPETQAEAEPEVTLEDVARRTGWVPKEDFRGDPEMWKPAHQYILDGRSIQETQTKKLAKLESTLDTLARTNAAVMEQEINRRVDELAGKYQRAVDEGDTSSAYRLANEIGALTAPKVNVPSGPPPEAQEFAQRNASWFQKDPLATALSVEVCNRLAAQGYDNATQLAAAEKEVRRVYPQLFGGQMNGAKQQAGVNRPGGRGPVTSTREKGFAEMPLEAQKVANDMIERGVIKTNTPEEAKKLYAKNYWQNAERKA